MQSAKWSPESTAAFLTGMRPALEKAGIVRSREVPAVDQRVVLDHAEITTEGRVEYEERWRSHPTLPLDVSTLGNVRRSDGGNVPVYVGGTGYKFINSGRRSHYVHRLVLETWIGPRPSGGQARHLDGRRTRNTISNLAWGSAAQNMADKKQHGRCCNAPHLSEYGRQRCREMLLSGKFKQREIAERLGISERAVGAWRKKLGIPNRFERAALLCGGGN